MPKDKMTNYDKIRHACMNPDKLKQYSGQNETNETKRIRISSDYFNDLGLAQWSAVDTLYIADLHSDIEMSTFLIASFDPQCQWNVFCLKSYYIEEDHSLHYFLHPYLTVGCHTILKIWVKGINIDFYGLYNEM